MDIDFFVQNAIVWTIVAIAAALVNLLIIWFIIYTAVRSAVRDDRIKAARERRP